MRILSTFKDTHTQANENNESDVNMISSSIVRDVVFYTTFTNFAYS